MNLSPERFTEYFKALYGMAPFPWQSRLANDLARDEWPDCIDLPTASGKTSLIDIAVYTLASQAIRPPADRTIGRRIFFTVNRRVIVDEAHQRAIQLAKALKAADGGILREVADGLRAIGGKKDLPLDVVQLRGGIYRDSSWARSVVQPTIICSTADQLGSRLLFRGYGVSPGMQPIHAALCGCDSLVLLDEAHVTKAFSQTLRLLQRYQQYKPGMRFIEMTATPSQQLTRRFELDDDDRVHPVLEARQKAPKPTELCKVSQKSLVSEIVKRATGAIDEQCQAIGVIVNRVQTARDVHARLRELHPNATHLVIGRMRPLDRDELQEQLRTLVGPDRPDVLDEAVFVVATQCLEVGADYDFDALVTECASIDALRQRFGRLNRKGRDIAALATVITTDAALEDDDPVYGSSLSHTWNWLTEDGRTVMDFGIAAFATLWDELTDEQRTFMVNSTPDAAVLLPAHLDALCQTNPQPVPSPDVSYFIHGPQRDNADVGVCWRADLSDDNQSHWAGIVGLLPPTSPECMTVPLRALRQWMLGADQPSDADVPMHVEEPTRDKRTVKRFVLRWRGAKDAVLVSEPNELRPGDTIVIPASDDSSRILGHLPDYHGMFAYDRAEAAFEQARRQRVVRLHPAIHPELMQPFRSYLAASDGFGKGRIREALGDLASDFMTGPAEVEYPDKSGVVFRFNTLLAPKDDWKQDAIIEDDGEDSSSDSTRPLPLSQHVADVLEATRQCVKCLGVDDVEQLFVAAARYHDVGKADLRFTAMLAGVSPYEAVGRPALAKSANPWLTPVERSARRRRAMLPDNCRHEVVSMQWLDHYFGHLPELYSIDRDLLLHLIGSHHGYARPLVPVCHDQPDDPDLLEFEVEGLPVLAHVRQSWTPAHRLDSGVAERFWKLTRQHGWWGLAYLESILRLADHQASAMEQRRGTAAKEVARE